MGENSAATPKVISNILKEVSMIDDFSMKSSTLDFYAHLLQEEMRKIGAFNRELPLCMYLVQDAIELLKGESLKWKTKQMESVIREQFIPLKKNDFFENGGVKRSDESNEKKNWLRSAQLSLEYENPDCGSVGQGSSFQSRGSALVPFKRSTNVGIQMEEKKASPPSPPVSLSMLVDDVEPIELNHLNVKKDFSGIVRAQELHEMYPKEHKKQRRCWSPELHRLFVDALRHLGGHKFATPKMIREFMQVDGLTDDEVKSHLQKYRLHIKNHPSSSAGPSKLPSWLNRNQYVDLNNAGSSDASKSPFHDGSGSTKMGSDSASESMDEDGRKPWLDAANSPVQCKTGLRWFL